MTTVHSYTATQSPLMVSVTGKEAVVLRLILPSSQVPRRQLVWSCLSSRETYRYGLYLHLPLVVDLTVKPKADKLREICQNERSRFWFACGILEYTEDEVVSALFIVQHRQFLTQAQELV